MSIVISMQKLLRGPSFLYGWYMFLSLVGTILSMMLLNVGHPEGDQMPLVVLAYAINYFIYGFLLLTLIVALVYWKWFVKNLHIYAIIAGIAMLMFLIGYFQ